MVVANNRSFFNDELHQERVARMRNRPVENRWIGQRIADPEVDIAQLARAQGAQGFGPVADGGGPRGDLPRGDRCGGRWRRRGGRRARGTRLFAGRDRQGCSARDGLLVRAVSAMPPRGAGAAVRRCRGDARRCGRD